MSTFLPLCGIKGLLLKFVELIPVLRRLDALCELNFLICLFSTVKLTAIKFYSPCLNFISTTHLPTSSEAQESSMVKLQIYSKSNMMLCKGSNLSSQSNEV